MSDSTTEQPPLPAAADPVSADARKLQIALVDAATGELVKTVSAALTVLPQGLQDLPFENTNPIAIPDNNSAGITSLINVPDAATAFAVTVSVDISHSWIGDLTVKLRSPTGTEYTLHNKEGGSADNLVKSWTLKTLMCRRPGRTKS